MNIFKWLPVFVFAVFIEPVFPQATETEFYVLKVYTLADETQESVTDTYLKESYLPALKNRNISQVGVFKLRPEAQKDSIRQVFVLFPLSSLNELAVLEETLFNEESLQNAANPFINAPHDQPPYVRMETILMKAFKEMPKMKPSPVEGPREDRVYELRSYESPTDALYRNKVHMFNEGGEVTLFDTLDFNAVFYADVLAGAKMPNLMYMTTFKDMETRERLWKDFVDSAKWQELSSDPFYQNNVSHADILLLYPTPYSDY